MSRSPASSIASLAVAARSLARELPGASPLLLIVALLSCLLIPLPTVLVDLLLSLSLAGSVLLLVAGLRVARAAEFLAFPTLVLLSTLYRLALNVSTTRLILSQADAGRVIDAFANLVVRGDLLVGAVMFGIISAIQYLVIARGAERVAEVAARFALDGMPGEQAAIDADLRAGTIGPRDAQARRAALSERSEFFARMDGVMRWVRGDAIVGLLITAINLIGGMAVGGVRSGLSIGESLMLYGKLAIGDGLLAQIPALLIAMAAAILVARVDRSSEHPSTSWLQPSMLVVPAAFLGLLAPVPGMPTLAFSTAAVGLLATALWIAARDDGTQPNREPEIRVRTHVHDGSVAPLSKDLAQLRIRCEQALAIPVPRLVLEPLAAGSLANGELELRLGERVLGRGRATHPPGGRESADTLLLGCFHVLMDNAERLVTLDWIEAELEHVRRRRSALVRQAMRVVEPVDVLAIVRAFVRERIPFPSMDALLEVLAERRVFRDLAERPHWPEHAREALADHWLRDLCDGLEALGRPIWVRPTADFEQAVVARAQVGEHGTRLNLSPSERARMLAKLGELPSEKTSRHLLLCGSQARPAFASLLSGVRPHVPVLSVGELSAAGVELPACLAVDLD